jgi:hypothetical protein
LLKRHVFPPYSAHAAAQQQFSAKRSRGCAPPPLRHLHRRSPFRLITALSESRHAQGEIVTQAPLTPAAPRRQHATCLAADATPSAVTSSAVIFAAVIDADAMSAY